MNLPEILGGTFGFIMLLIGVIFFSLIGILSFFEVFEKSIWSNLKQSHLKKIIYEKFSAIVMMIFSFALVYYLVQALIEFFN